MANYELKFIDFYDDTDFISCKNDNSYNAIRIELYEKSIGESSVIYLDKSTAIKFAKTLRTEINKIQG